MLFIWAASWCNVIHTVGNIDGRIMIYCFYGCEKATCTPICEVVSIPCCSKFQHILRMTRPRPRSWPRRGFHCRVCISRTENAHDIPVPFLSYVAAVVSPGRLHDAFHILCRWLRCFVRREDICGDGHVVMMTPCRASISREHRDLRVL